jgi:hypothetical protein
MFLKNVCFGVFIATTGVFHEVSAFQQSAALSSPGTITSSLTSTKTKTALTMNHFHPHNVPSRSVVAAMKLIHSSSNSSVKQQLSCSQRRHFSSSLLTSTKASIIDATDDVNMINDALTSPPTIQSLSPTTNTFIFIIGIIPFLWATYEFWSRIAVGKNFGTGSDSIQIRPPSSSKTTIGKDGDPLKSRGQRVLGDDALLVAYVLFAVAIGAVGIAIYSVISTHPPGYNSCRQ